MQAKEAKLRGPLQILENVTEQDGSYEVLTKRVYIDVSFFPDHLRLGSFQVLLLGSAMPDVFFLQDSIAGEVLLVSDNAAGTFARLSSNIDFSNQKQVVGLAEILIKYCEYNGEIKVQNPTFKKDTVSGKLEVDLELILRRSEERLNRKVIFVGKEDAYSFLIPDGF